MAQMTPVGLVFCAFCLITQVLSQSTVAQRNSTAVTGNQTSSTTVPFSAPANSTTAPAGTGVLTQASALNVLVPVAMVTGLLQRWC